MWLAFILAFAVAMAVSDLCTRKLPNYFTTAALAVGLAFHAIFGGLLSALLASLIAFGVGILFFRLGAIGGGDVKLITALAAMLGLPLWATAMEIAVLVAGAIALVQVLRRRAVQQTVSNIGELLGRLTTEGVRAHPVLNVSNAAAVRAPFAVAAAVGTVVAVFLR